MKIEINADLDESTLRVNRILLARILERGDSIAAELRIDVDGIPFGQTLREIADWLKDYSKKEQNAITGRKDSRPTDELVVHDWPDGVCGCATCTLMMMEEED